jgi:hypothetical protein
MDKVPVFKINYINPITDNINSNQLNPIQSTQSNQSNSTQHNSITSRFPLQSESTWTRRKYKRKIKSKNQNQKNLHTKYQSKYYANQFR